MILRFFRNSVKSVFVESGRTFIVILVSAAISSVGCSGSDVKNEIKNPVPTNVSSILFRDQDDASASRYSEYLVSEEYSRFRGYFQNYSSGQSVTQRLVKKSLKTIASEMQGLPTGTALIEGYKDDIEKVRDSYEEAGELASALGIERTELLAGAGAAAGAAITTIGGLHLVKPRATIGKLPWTEIEAGYDVKEIDNPKFVLSSGGELSFVVSKEGFSGALSDEGRVYQVNLDIQRQRATANLSFQRGFSLGSRISLKEESLTGFVNIGL